MKQPKFESAGPAEDARLQAEMYDSIFSSTPLKLDNGETLMIPPHPDFGMLDDDRMEDYEDLLMEVEDYDREPDVFIPEQTLSDGAVVPSETIKGQLKRPFRKDGVRVKPAHSVRLVQAAIGPDDYAKLRAGGKSAADVWKIWGKQGLEIQARRDPKSEGSVVALGAVPEADSE
ncbi:hypothetical protein FHT44_005128 [Mycolicibacterium sp. BK634]|uniref:hypothetical protein n=1 Tax=Mycolicibacterium sp. BK634 TaxID=2587099 RepID=UPI001610D4B2|nr:hypothetical protein [Mycolicibacterium sp. BK634]MBB3752616.1 hypothetical protein [Mycolicibacterium sp. BK634]